MSLPTPNTRKEQYLNAIATGNAGGLPTPITREEEYLDAIAKSGGGSGDGDMKKSVYDSDLDVAGAGGIKAFVNSAVAGKVDKVEGKGLSTNDYTDEAKAIVDSVTDALAGKADTDDIPDLVSDNLAKGIFGNETVLSTDNVPFVSKIMGAGAYQRKKFVGCSFVWNQQIVANAKTATYTWESDSSTYRQTLYSFAFDDRPTLYANHVYFMSANLSRTISTNDQVSLQIGVYNAVSSIGFLQNGSSNGVICNIRKRDTDITCTDIFANNYSGKQSFAQGDTVSFDNLFIVDLTQLFGSTVIADAIYNLEQATAGVGIAKLKELGFFTEDYYAYDAGSVQSVDIKEYKVTKDNIVTTYSLTPTELRGVAKIDANNNIYCDGDEYASDGGHNVKYGIVDLGTLNYTYVSTADSPCFSVSASSIGIKTSTTNVLIPGYTYKHNFYNTEGNDKCFDVGLNFVISNFAYTDPADFKTAMSGVYLIYEKATPTTETLTPFDYPQSVGSLEEITDYKVEQEERDVAIPTGHVTEYMGKGGEFTLPTLPETPSVLAFDGHNFFWKPETA